MLTKALIASAAAHLAVVSGAVAQTQCPEEFPGSRCAALDIFFDPELPSEACLFAVTAAYADAGSEFVVETTLPCPGDFFACEPGFNAPASFEVNVAVNSCDVADASASSGRNIGYSATASVGPDGIFTCACFPDPGPAALSGCSFCFAFGAASSTGYLLVDTSVVPFGSVDAVIPLVVFPDRRQDSTFDAREFFSFILAGDCCEAVIFRNGSAIVTRNISFNAATGTYRGQSITCERPFDASGALRTLRLDVATDDLDLNGDGVLDADDAAELQARINAGTTADLELFNFSNSSDLPADPASGGSRTAVFDADDVDVFLQIIDCYQTLSEAGNPIDCEGDINGDGAVNVVDLLIVLGEFGSFCNP